MNVFVPVAVLQQLLQQRLGLDDAEERQLQAVNLENVILSILTIFSNKL